MIGNSNASLSVLRAITRTPATVAQLGYDVNAGWAGRANNCNFIMGSRERGPRVSPGGWRSAPKKAGRQARLPMRHVLGGRHLSALREVMRPAVKRTDSRSNYARPLLVIVLSTCSTNREYDRLKALLAATRTSKGSRPCATSVCNTRSHAPQSWATNW